MSGGDDVKSDSYEVARNKLIENRLRVRRRLSSARMRVEGTCRVG